MANNQPNPTPLRGMPILSGAPPISESQNCRQCSKPFNLLLRRAHACGHCGYEYCSTCISDGQALMPRRTHQTGGSSSSTRAGSSSGGGASGFFSEVKEGFREALGMDEPAAPGYEVEKVCLPCLAMLQVTAAPLQVLRSLPLKRLKDYLAAYNIPLVGPKEKEDFVQAVVKARNPRTGCLSPEAESYYRRKSVPKGEKSTSVPQPPARPQPPQPPRAPQPPRQPAPPHPPHPPSQPARVTPQAQYRPSPPHIHTTPRPQPASPRPAAPSPRATPAPAAKPTPPPPVPTILSLVSLPKSYLASLSIGTLKAVLYENHVRVDFKQVLEKEELINRVHELILDERKRLERQRIEEERLSNPAPITVHLQPMEGQSSDAQTGSDEAINPPAEDTAAKTVPTGPMPEIERGLCVVCQDEEATLAVVDCGHLAMCAHCSDLIMATSQECPLCRTRIVTPQRLIRIYRV